jgi:hypothetical protein
MDERHQGEGKTAKPKSHMKKAISALVLAIIAAGIGWAGYGGFIFGIPALILGILAVRDAGASRTIGIIGIVFACIGIAESVAAAAFIAAVTESTSPREVTGVAGTEVRVDNWGVIVSEPIYTDKFYECGYIENYYLAFTPTAGYQFALVKMKVINRGVEERSPEFYDAKFVTTGGLMYEVKYPFELKEINEEYTEPPSPIYPFLSIMEEVPPGECIEGYLYFEIPSGAKADSLTFKSGILPETDVVIKF